MPYQRALTIAAPVRTGAVDELEAPPRDDGQRRRERIRPRLRRADRRPLRAARGRVTRTPTVGRAAAGEPDLPERPRRLPRDAPRRARERSRASTASSATATAIRRRRRDASPTAGLPPAPRRQGAGPVREHNRPDVEQIRQEAELRDGDRALPRRRGLARTRSRRGPACRGGARRQRSRARLGAGAGGASRRARTPARAGAPRRDPVPARAPAAVALLAAPVFALVLWRHERRDEAPHVKPENARVLELAALEDHIVQNPFMAVGR